MPAKSLKTNIFPCNNSTRCSNEYQDKCSQQFSQVLIHISHNQTSYSSGLQSRCEDFNPDIYTNIVFYSRQNTMSTEMTGPVDTIR